MNQWRTILSWDVSKLQRTQDAYLGSLVKSGNLFGVVVAHNNNALWAAWESSRYMASLQYKKMRTATAKPASDGGVLGFIIKDDNLIEIIQQLPRHNKQFVDMSLWLYANHRPTVYL